MMKRLLILSSILLMHPVDAFCESKDCTACKDTCDVVTFGDSALREKCKASCSACN
jgi:hypothetical protein